MIGPFRYRHVGSPSLLKPSLIGGLTIALCAGVESFVGGLHDTVNARKRYRTVRRCGELGHHFESEATTHAMTDGTARRVFRCQNVECRYFEWVEVGPDGIPVVVEEEVDQ